MKTSKSQKFECTGSPCRRGVCFWIFVGIALAACSGKKEASSDGASKTAQPVEVAVFLRPDDTAPDIIDKVLPLMAPLKDRVTFRFYPIAPGSKPTASKNAHPESVVNRCGYDGVAGTGGYTYVSRDQYCQKVPKDGALVCGQKYGHNGNIGAYADCYFKRLNENNRGIRGLNECVPKEGALGTKYNICTRGAEGAELLRASYALAGTHQVGDGDFLLFVNGQGYKGFKSLKDAICPLLQENGAESQIELCTGYTAGTASTFTVITDQNCPLPECRDSVFADNVRSLFENAYITEIDWSNQKAKTLFGKLGLTHLPVAVSNGDIHTATAYPKRLELLKQVKETGQYVYSPAKGWDPWTEICDDGKDNNGDGKVDCEADSCKKQLQCQKETPRRLDMFVSLPLLSVDTNALYMMQYLSDGFVPDGRENDASGINFKIHFVPQHALNPPTVKEAGEADVVEAMRRLCIQKMYSANWAFLDYVNCRRGMTGDRDFEQCLLPKMNAGLITACVAGEEGKTLLADSYRMAQSMAVSKTPYWVVNGKYPVKPAEGSVSVETPSEIVALVCEKNKSVDGCQPEGKGTSRPVVEWRYAASAGVRLTKTEITVDQFRHFLSGRPVSLKQHYAMFGSYSDAPDNVNSDSYLPFAGYRDYPIAGVAPEDAEQFCQWMGGRLPTEAEWLSEATDNWRRRWPWGNEPITCNRAVMGRGEYEKWPCPGKGYSKVCSKDAGQSVSGLCDLVGNVHEVVRADFRNSEYVPLVGGAYTSFIGGFGAMDKMEKVFDSGYDAGFRCAKSDTPETEFNATESNQNFEAACKRLTGLVADVTVAPIPGDLTCDGLDDNDPRVKRLSEKHLFLREAPASSPREADRFLGFDICMPFKSGAVMLKQNPVPCRKGDALESVNRPVMIYAPAEGDISHVDLSGLDYMNPIEPMRINGPFDLFGTGKSDTLKLYQSYNCEEFSGSWTSLIRYANGRLETIDFSNHIDGEFVLIAIRDETGDGRPDLIFKRSVYGTQCGSGFSEEYDTLNVLAEISGDGAFDFNSNAAIAFMRTQCPAPPEALNTIEKVACARVWGVSEADALAGIKKVRREGCKSETDSSDDYPALLAAAKVQFPLVLVPVEAKQLPDTQSDTETDRNTNTVQ